MIISPKENKQKETAQKFGTYIYALYQNSKVVQIGQCSDINSMTMKKISEKEVEFERVTYTFMEGVEPYSYESNLMESVAVNMLAPTIKEELVHF